MKKIIPTFDEYIKEQMENKKEIIQNESNTNTGYNLELVKEIEDFVDTYAGIRPDYDPEYDELDEKYTSPDAYEMLRVASELKTNQKVFYPHSTWASGGYHPYNDKVGEQKHDELKSKIKEFIKLQNEK